MLSLRNLRTFIAFKKGTAGWAFSSSDSAQAESSGHTGPWGGLAAAGELIENCAFASPIFRDSFQGGCPAPEARMDRRNVMR